MEALPSNCNTTVTSDRFPLVAVSDSVPNSLQSNAKWKKWLETRAISSRVPCPSFHRLTLCTSPQLGKMTCKRRKKILGRLKDKR